MTDGIVEGGLVWVPGHGLGHVVDLSALVCTVDVPRLAHVVRVLRTHLIPGEIAAVIGAAHMANEWGKA